MVKNLPFIRKVLSDFSSSTYKQRVIVQKGALTSVVDKVEFLHGGWGLISDDFDDVAQAIQALRKDLINIIKDLKGAQNIQQQLQADLQAGQTETDLMFEDKSAATPASPPASPTPASSAAPAPQSEKGTWQSLEDSAKSILGGGLSGLFGN